MEAARAQAQEITEFVRQEAAEHMYTEADLTEAQLRDLGAFATAQSETNTQTTTEETPAILPRNDAERPVARLQERQDG